MKPSEEIRKTKKVLMRYGWVQNRFISYQGVCILGALGIVQAGNANHYASNVWDNPTLEIMRQALPVDTPIDGRSIPGWQDEFNRTFSEVCDYLDVCEKQALILEEG